MKISKRVALLPLLFLLTFASVSYANSTSIKATVTVISQSQLCVVTSSVTSNFNGNAIAQGKYIWFTSHLKVNGPVTGLTVIDFKNQKITFTANSVTYNLQVPDAEVIIDPAATGATTVFDGTKWVTTVPTSLSGDVFLSGLSYLVPTGLPGGINPVVWSGTFSSTSNFNVQWQWAAAVYTSFSTDYTKLGVKPVDDNSKSKCKNSDPAGTPENYKKFVIGGARGKGGSDFIGSNSDTGSAICETTPLKITIISPQNTSYNKNCVPLTFTINKPTSWIEYSLDGKSNVTITKSITLTGLSEGTHSIIVYAKDKSGNWAKSNIVYFTIVKGLLGSVDIGKMNNEMAYWLGWSKPQPNTSGGTWGGVTDPTYWRTVACTYCKEGNSAYAFVIAGENPKTIRIEHLDGIADDSFDVYVLDFLKWVNIGSYKDQYSDGSEHIVTTDFNITNSVHIFGFVEVKITLTGKPWASYKTYGQLAIHKIDVLGLSDCDNEHDDKH